MEVLLAAGAEVDARAKPSEEFVTEITALQAQTDEGLTEQASGHGGAGGQRRAWTWTCSQRRSCGLLIAALTDRGRVDCVIA